MWITELQIYFTDLSLILGIKESLYYNHNNVNPSHPKLQKQNVGGGDVKICAKAIIYDTITRRGRRE